MFGQTSQNFTFNKNEVIISKDISETKNIIVFNGEVTEEETSSSTPILGKIKEKENTVYFIPLVPFGWNQKYTVFYNHTIRYFSLPIPKDYESLKISKIFPSASRLPSNILKWYIKFSKPINKNNIYKYIRFVSDSGDTIPRAILPLENALISDDGTLLTIWVEPGRQKRNLIPNKQLGSVFSNNKKYQLVISKEIKDTNGVSMLEDFYKQFIIINADRNKPNIRNWQIKIPIADSMSDLLIYFEESIDYGSSIDNILILDDKGQSVKGDCTLLNEEKIFSFKPKKQWKKGKYEIYFDSAIEDLAGNNLNRLFDDEIHNTSKIITPSQNHKLEFIIK